MKLTWDIFDYLLKRRYEAEHFGNWHGERVIRRIYRGKPTSEETDVLYVDICRDLNTLEAWSGNETYLSIVPETLREKLNGKKGYFIFCKKEELDHTENAVLNLYLEYREWVYEMDNAAFYEYSIERVLNSAAHFLNVSLSLVNRMYQVEYQVLSDISASWNEVLNEQGEMTVPSIQNLYIENPAFDETFDENGLIFYPYMDRPGVRTYYYNIFYCHTYLCRLLIEVEETEKLLPLHQLLEYLCVCLKRCYIHNYKESLKNPNESVFRSFWSDAAAGKPYTRAEAAKALKGIGWDSRDAFLVVKLQPNGYGNSSQTLKFFCTQFENTFPNTYAAENGKAIYALWNLSMQENKDIHRTNISVFLRENLLIAGISCPFSDFFDLDFYIREAEIALKLGQKKNPSFWIYEFGDYRLEYMVGKLTEELPVHDLCHQALVILKEYDRSQPDSHLVLTLYEYIKCRFNAAEAAEKLHIHRTTFFYRLRRIQELTDIHLEDWKEWVLLVFSFIMEEKRKDSPDDN